jgi:hypothetical protein
MSQPHTGIAKRTGKNSNNGTTETGTAAHESSFAPSSETGNAVQTGMYSGATILEIGNGVLPVTVYEEEIQSEPEVELIDNEVVLEDNTTKSDTSTVENVDVDPTTVGSDDSTEI